MPQMAPYNWLMLNLMFSIILILYLTFMYYTQTLNFKKFNKISSKKFLINW